MNRFIMIHQLLCTLVVTNLKLAFVRPRAASCYWRSSCIACAPARTANGREEIEVTSDDYVFAYQNTVYNITHHNTIGILQDVELCPPNFHRDIWGWVPAGSTSMGSTQSHKRMSSTTAPVARIGGFGLSFWTDSFHQWPFQDPRLEVPTIYFWPIF
jgi:hypothetical protein